MGGYYLHTLFNIFGPVRRACGFSFTNDAHRPYLNTRHSKFNEDFYMDTENTICGALEFRNGVHATMAITSECRASDNAFEIIGTDGTLYLGDPNNFTDKVYYRKASSPDPVEFPLTHPYFETGYRGIAIADMAWAIRTNRPHRLCAEMGFHALEVQHGILDSGLDGQFRTFDTVFKRPAPIQPMHYGGTTDERNLYLYEDEDGICVK